MNNKSNDVKNLSETIMKRIVENLINNLYEELEKMLGVDITRQFDIMVECVDVSYFEYPRQAAWDE